MRRGDVPVGVDRWPHRLGKRIAGSLKRVVVGRLEGRVIGRLGRGDFGRGLEGGSVVDTARGVYHLRWCCRRGRIGGFRVDVVGSHVAGRFKGAGVVGR